MSKSDNYAFEHTCTNGKTYQIEFEADFEKEDVGIGRYEYWGSTGNDVQIIYTCEHISIAAVTDEKEKDVTDKLSKKIQDEIDDACFQYANENAPEYAPSSEEDYD